jgi:hypothetical protein
MHEGDKWAELAVFNKTVDGNTGLDLSSREAYRTADMPAAVDIDLSLCVCSCRNQSRSYAS